MKSRLGQNFLIDKNIARKIAVSGEISQSDTVVEIGPGRGILTEELAKISKRVIAVEIDKKLADYLSGKFNPVPMHKCGVKIINSDFLKWSPPLKKKLCFIANLPYYISTAVIEKILSIDNWDTAVFTVQKEVAGRIKAGPGSKDYGVLSVACQLFCKVEKLFDIPPHCFSPSPKVISSVIRLRRTRKQPIKEKDEKKFFKIVKASFAHRRKIILNSLYTELGIEKKLLEKNLSDSGIPPLCRAETVSIGDFIKLTEKLTERKQTRLYKKNN
ncbi:MAG: ribosomal RNA small subunit methyltransferase A [Elusimicrobia bacterium]|nr:ribosomal RNA small subunit methyltransferase A [Elusimicrobiota bacterium]